MSVKKITVPDIGTVHLYKRRGTKSLRLSVSHAGQIRISMPPWVPYRFGIEFVLKKQSWLAQNQKTPTILRERQRIGKAHWLTFVNEPKRIRITSRIGKAGEIRVLLPASVDTTHSVAQTTAERACLRALRYEAEELLPQRLKILASQHGFSYKSVSIKRLRSRWGSCSEHNDVVLNCYLVQLPWELIDYVLLHELLHTQVMAHGTPFWSELAKYVYNLPEVRKEIRKYQPSLILQ